MIAITDECKFAIISKYNFDNKQMGINLDCKNVQLITKKW